MTQTLKSLADAARDLPPDQQADLIDELVVNLTRADPGWNAAWSADADRRWNAQVANGHPGHAAEDVLTDISAHLTKMRRRKP